MHPGYHVSYPRILPCIVLCILSSLKLFTTWTSNQKQMFGFRCHVNEFLVGNIVSRSSFTTFQSVSCLSWRASDTVKVCGQVRKERWWLCWWPRLRDEVSQNGPHTPRHHHSSAEGNSTITRRSWTDQQSYSPESTHAMLSSQSSSPQRSKLKNTERPAEHLLLTGKSASVCAQRGHAKRGIIHGLALCMYTSSPRGESVYLLLEEADRTQGGRERRLPICLDSPQNSSQLS